MTVGPFNGQQTVVVKYTQQQAIGLSIVLDSYQAPPTRDPANPEKSAQVTIQIIDASGNPLQQQASVELSATAVGGTGGHAHNDDRPAGNFFGPGVVTASTTVIVTDANGRANIDYSASVFGGSETIRANLSNDPNISTSTVLAVMVPSLALFPDAAYYVKTGATPLHPGDNNHFLLTGAIADLQDAAAEFLKQTGEQMELNDMSLPNGGGFDLSGSWDSDVIPPSCAAIGHCGHKRGTNVDIENLAKINDLIGVMERHHWHFFNEGQLSGGSTKFPHFYWQKGS